MMESLTISLCLEEQFDAAAFEALLRHCFDELECSRSPPDSDDTSQFRYITSETDYDLVRGASVDQAIRACVRAESGTLWLWYDDLDLGIHRSPDPDTEEPVGIPTISLLINEWYVKPRNNDQPKLIPEFVHELYDYLSPIYVIGDTYLDGSAVSEMGIKRRELEALFWVNGFGPKMVDQLGREQLLEAPAWRVDEREDGGIFLWASELPLSMDRNENMEALREYFGFES